MKKEIYLWMKETCDGYSFHKRDTVALHHAVKYEVYKFNLVQPVSEQWLLL